MRLALALVLAIIATVHNTGASAQKATPEVRALSGECGHLIAVRIRNGEVVSTTTDLRDAARVAVHFYRQ